MNIDKDKYYTVQETADIMGYTSRMGVEYLLKKGHIRANETKSTPSGPRDQQRKLIIGSAIIRLTKRFSFRHKMHNDEDQS